MKRVYPIVIIGSFVGFLGSCKKDVVKMKDTGIVGTWQETKLDIRQSSGMALQNEHDTIFNKISFTDADYIQFKGDKSATVSVSGLYDISGKTIVLNGGTLAKAVTQYTYSIADSTLTLTVKAGYQHPTNGTTGPDYQTAIIKQLDATHITLRTYLFSPAPTLHQETAYYTKVE